MLKLNIDTYVNNTKTQDFEKIGYTYEKYFKNLQSKLDEIGQIVVEGIQEGILNRSYPGGNIDVKRGGTPLYLTGELYRSIVKQKVNDSEVDVYIQGNRSKIGMYQQNNGREFFGIYQNTEQQIDNLLKEIVSDITKNG